MLLSNHLAAAVARALPVGLEDRIREVHDARRFGAVGKPETVTQFVRRYLQRALAEPGRIFAAAVIRVAQPRQGHHGEAAGLPGLAEDEVESGSVGIGVDQPDDAAGAGRSVP